MTKGIYNEINSILPGDPKALYQEEQGLLKEPFYFPGTNGKAVLLLHGWTSVPYELRRLGKYLNENDYTVSGPMLRGHGTVSKDLENVYWEDWLCDATKAYEELAKNHEDIYVAGTSLGANLTVMLAKNKPKISGIILMAMPYAVRFERLGKAVLRFANIFTKYGWKFYPPFFGSPHLVTRMISYRTYPIKSVLEVADLIKISRQEISKVTQPCFVMQSNRDIIIPGNSLEKIYEKISSKVKEKKYVHKAYHTFISDIKNEHIFQDILNFINKN
ncbi:MAG: alpha/beta fold hydrolase [Parcubacteria group bacterium]|jgi:carboxylesterase